jgi:lysozyme family protein
MPSAAFSESLPFILRWEGGYVNHPADRGGPTNKGITQSVYDDWRQRQSLPQRDVKTIDDDEVGAIYERGYWVPPRCDALQRQLDLVQFDTAVNMGVGRAVRFLQQALGCTADGNFGPATQQALGACDAGDTIVKYCKVREAFYQSIVQKDPSQAVFLKGWLNRLNSLRHEVGLPGFEAAQEFDFGDTDYIARVPDVGKGSSYDDL